MLMVSFVLLAQVELLPKGTININIVHEVFIAKNMIPKLKLYYISVKFSLNAGERGKFGDGPVSQPERRYAPEN